MDHQYNQQAQNLAPQGGVKKPTTKIAEKAKRDRLSINSRLDTLKTLVPGGDAQPSKARLLDRVIQYIQELEQKSSSESLGKTPASHANCVQETAATRQEQITPQASHLSNLFKEFSAIGQSAQLSCDDGEVSKRNVVDFSLYNGKTEPLDAKKYQTGINKRQHSIDQSAVIGQSDLHMGGLVQQKQQQQQQYYNGQHRSSPRQETSIVSNYSFGLGSLNDSLLMSLNRTVRDEQRQFPAQLPSMVQQVQPHNHINKQCNDQFIINQDKQTAQLQLQPRPLQDKVNCSGCFDMGSPQQPKVALTGEPSRQLLAVLLNSRCIQLDSKVLDIIQPQAYPRQ